MQRVENALKMKDEQFKRILGTTQAVFRQMLTVLQLAYSFAHEKGGNPGEEVLGGEEVVVDVAEYPIERPKNKQRDWYSGKKKAHASIANRDEPSDAFDLLRSSG